MVRTDGRDALDIHLKKTRRTLEPRREPYWRTFRKGAAIGFRCIAANGEGTWIARWIDPDTRKKRYHALGPVAGTDYQDAARLADDWFDACEAGGGGCFSNANPISFFKMVSEIVVMNRVRFLALAPLLIKVRICRGSLW